MLRQFRKIPKRFNSQLPSLISETQAAGLGGYGPVGIVQSSIELIHTTTGLPWWLSLIAFSGSLRVMLTPLTIMTQQIAGKMAEHQVPIQQQMERIQMARMEGKREEAMILSQKLNEYQKENDCQPLKSVFFSLIPLPIYISSFLAIRGMATSSMASMHTGGAYWFTDLAASDPYYIIPILSAFGMVANFKISQIGTNAPYKMMTPIVAAMSILSTPLIANLPTAVTIYFLGTNFFSVIFTSFLKIPAVRDLLKIPVAKPKTETVQPGATGMGAFMRRSLGENIAHFRRMRQLKVKSIPFDEKLKRARAMKQ